MSFSYEEKLAAVEAVRNKNHSCSSIAKQIGSAKETYHIFVFLKSVDRKDYLEIIVRKFYNSEQGQQKFAEWEKNQMESELK